MLRDKDPETKRQIRYITSEDATIVNERSPRRYEDKYE